MTSPAELRAPRSKGPGARLTEKSSARPLFLAQVALLVSTLALLYGPGLAEHVRYAADPWHFNDDARQQIWPFLRYADPRLLQNDYISDYFLASFPRGFSALYGLGAAVADPRTLSKAVPYAELLVVLYCLIASAWRLAGPAAAWATGALCLSADVYLARMAGGLPRSFAFPLVALAILALVRGKPWRLCALVVGGAAFYFPVAAMIGFMAAAYIFLLPRSWQGEARVWSWRRRLGTLAATALAAALVAAPAFVASRSFGPLIGRGDLGAFPEAWRGGRYGDLDLPLAGKLGRTTAFYAEAPVLPLGPPWDWTWRKPLRRAVERSDLVLTLYWAVIAAGTVSLLAERAAARRLVSVIVGAFAFYAASFAAWPWFYLPARGLTYTLPLLTPVVLPAALASLAGRWRITRAPPVRAAIVVGSAAFLVFVFGASGPGRAGIRIDVAAEMRPLYEHIASLAPSSLIAGWPEDTIDNVPYLTGRKILVGFETHQALHRRYAEEMRRRMEALIDAYFSNDRAALRRLKTDFGVTHLLVDRRHYGRRPPRYFKPFDERIERAAHDLRGQPETLRQAPAAAVIEVGPLVLLDLGRVAER